MNKIEGKGNLFFSWKNRKIFLHLIALIMLPILVFFKMKFLLFSHVYCYKMIVVTDISGLLNNNNFFLVDTSAREEWIIFALIFFKH